MSELRSLCEDCGEGPAAAKAALNFRDWQELSHRL
jgi:hypothetical protein